MSQHIKEIALLVSALDPESGGTLPRRPSRQKCPQASGKNAPRVGAILPAPAKMSDPEGGEIFAGGTPLKSRRPGKIKTECSPDRPGIYLLLWPSLLWSPSFLNYYFQQVLVLFVFFVFF